MSKYVGNQEINGKLTITNKGTVVTCPTNDNLQIKIVSSQSEVGTESNIIYFVVPQS
jgi:hypothetical protein